MATTPASAPAIARSSSSIGAQPSLKCTLALEPELPRELLQLAAR